MGNVVLKLADDVSTDVIYPGRYMATVLPTETPQFAFADNAALNAALRGGQVPPGSVIVAGKNFGCGSSREQAVSALKGYDLTIVAESFARIFLQNAINLGLHIVTAPGVRASVGDDLTVTTLSQSGDGPVASATTLVGWMSAFGPTGVVALSVDGLNLWLRVPTAS